MITPKTNYIAIDIAKDSLAVAYEQGSFEFCYDQKGLSKLLEFIKKQDHSVVVCEATGGYERPLMQVLFAHSIAVALLNPALVRAFARSEGIKAKTDPIDAKMLLRFALQKQPQPSQPNEPVRQLLIELMDRRSQLTEILIDEKNRLSKSNSRAKSSIETIIGCVEQELEAIEQEISQLIDSDALMQKQFQIMQDITGVGQTTAWTILAYLKEVTELGRNQIVALLGIAPYNRDSGKFSGKPFIQAGRAKVRKCLYMAAQSAAVHNPVIRTYVQRLRDRGKSYKSAIVAAMRKLLLHIRSLLKYS